MSTVLFFPSKYTNVIKIWRTLDEENMLCWGRMFFKMSKSTHDSSARSESHGRSKATFEHDCQALHAQLGKGESLTKEKNLPANPSNQLYSLKLQYSAMNKSACSKIRPVSLSTTKMGLSWQWIEDLKLAMTGDYFTCDSHQSKAD